MMAVLTHALAFQKAPHKKIIVCEPRRVAADGLYDWLKKIGPPVALNNNLFGIRHGKEKGNSYYNCKMAFVTSGRSCQSFRQQIRNDLLYNT